MQHDTITINGKMFTLMEEESTGRLSIIGTGIHAGTLCTARDGQIVDPDISDEDKIDLLTGRAFRHTLGRAKPVPRILRFLRP